MWSGSVGMVRGMCDRHGLHQSHDGYHHRRKTNKTTWCHNLEEQNLWNAVKISKLVVMWLYALCFSVRWKLLLGFSCRNRLLLSGTPIQNSMAELWALLHFIMPTLFDSHDEFNEWFSKDIESHAENKTGIDESKYVTLLFHCLHTNAWALPVYPVGAELLVQKGF